MMEINIIDYVRPELLVVAIVLYFLGNWIKQGEFIQGRYIPLALGFLGVLICGLYIFATGEFVTTQDIEMAVYSSITQGILVAGLSTYIHQLIKNHGSDKCDK